jgi:hypothetical protein
VHQPHHIGRGHVRADDSRQPITPLRLFAEVSRAGSFVARLLVGGMFGVFFFLTQPPKQ